jgi:DNA-binding NarL/FixJ family response regulator
VSIRVLIADDQALVRAGFKMILDAEDDLDVVGEAADGAAAVELARRLKPDVVLMDIGLPGVDGIEATRQLVADPDVTSRVLALSAFGDRRHLLDIFRAGATGYVVKDCVLGELVEAIQTVARGERYLSPAMASLVLSDLVTPGGDQRRDALTSREREVLRLLADGKAMKEAAVLLHISTKTVETHRRAIMEKLQLFSVAELTKHAIREGYSSLDERTS